ncbi:hypothetical protein ACFUV1_08470 [Streptomyces griseoincarnatus]
MTLPGKAIHLAFPLPTDTSEPERWQAAHPHRQELTMQDLPPSLPPAPLVEIRVGSLHLTIERLPIRLVTFLATLAGSAGATLLISR